MKKTPKLREGQKHFLIISPEGLAISMIVTTEDRARQSILGMKGCKLVEQELGKDGVYRKKRELK